MRSVRPHLMIGASLTLLTLYIYFHANLETFVVYLLALTLWAGLFGYCVRMREKQSDKAGTIIRGP